jgi:hypothetical protein
MVIILTNVKKKAKNWHLFTDVLVTDVWVTQGISALSLKGNR